MLVTYMEMEEITIQDLLPEQLAAIAYAERQLLDLNTCPIGE